MPSVLILAPPAGQAPQWVREAWVGLALPTNDEKSRSRQAVGILDGERGIRGWLRRALSSPQFVINGFEVPSAGAIAILEQADPKAAAWWGNHAPDFLWPEATFIFEEEVCQWRNSP